MPLPLSNKAYVNSLLRQNTAYPGEVWYNLSGAVNTEAHVIYSWDHTKINYTSTYPNPTALDATQKLALTTAFQLWSNVADIHFADREALGLTSPAQMVLAEFDIPRTTTSGEVTQRPHASSVRKTGQIDLVLDPQTTDFSVGGGGYLTAIHEVGHAISLTHPFNLDDLNTPTTDPRWLDQGLTIMSYNFVDTATSSAVALAASPMIYDIAAVQYLYGANTSYNSGTTTYGWVENIGPKHVVLDGTKKAWTIWDAGGSDIIDISSNSYGSKIDLRGGVDDKGTAVLTDDVVRFSEIKKAVPGQLGPSVEYIAIAFDPRDYDTVSGALKAGESGVVDIEHAIGGLGKDTIIGGYAASTLRGNGGNDILVAAAHWNKGNASIYGGDNDDIIWGGYNDRLTGDSGKDEIWLNDSAAYHYNDGVAGEKYVVWSGQNNSIQRDLSGPGGVIKNLTIAVHPEGAVLKLSTNNFDASCTLRIGAAEIRGHFYNASGAEYWEMGNGWKIDWDLGSSFRILDAHLRPVVTSANWNNGDFGITMHSPLEGGGSNQATIAPIGVLPEKIDFVKDYLLTPPTMGTAAGDEMVGGFGNETLSGLGGNDELDGLTGEDVLRPGTGSNTVTGGADRDRFVIATDTVAVTDTITDFNPAGGEVIDLSAFGTGLALSITQTGSTASNDNHAPIYTKIAA